MRCGMRGAPAFTTRIPLRCAAAEGAAGCGGFWGHPLEGEQSSRPRTYTRSPRLSPCSADKVVINTLKFVHRARVERDYLLSTMD